MSHRISLAQRPAWVNDFRAFIMRGNVVDLAVGIIIGAAFTGIVQSLVKDVLNPLIGLLTGGVDFSDLFITIKGDAKPTLAASRAAGAVTVNYGLFINAVFQFLIVAFAVFWLVRLMQKFVKSEAPAPSSTDKLLIEIRDLLAKQSQDAHHQAAIGHDPDHP